MDYNDFHGEQLSEDVVTKMIWIGQEKFIEHRGCAYKVAEESQDAVVNLEWAEKVLQNPCVTYQNGKLSHEMANEIVEKSEDILLDYRVIL